MTIFLPNSLQLSKKLRIFAPASNGSQHVLRHVASRRVSTLRCFYTNNPSLKKSLFLPFSYSQTSLIVAPTFNLATTAWRIKRSEAPFVLLIIIRADKKLAFQCISDLVVLRFQVFMGELVIRIDGIYIYNNIIYIIIYIILL